MIEPEAAPPAPQYPPPPPRRRGRRDPLGRGGRRLRRRPGGERLRGQASGPDGRQRQRHRRAESQDDPAGAPARRGPGTRHGGRQPVGHAVPLPGAGASSSRSTGTCPSWPTTPPPGRRPAPPSTGPPWPGSPAPSACPASPVQRDGGWFVDGGDWTLNAFPGGDMWSVDLFRGRSTGRRGRPTRRRRRRPRPVPPCPGPRPSAGCGTSSTGMGAPDGSWKVETTDTEIGIGWACAAPARCSPEETAAARGREAPPARAAERRPRLDHRQSPPRVPAAPMPGPDAPCPRARRRRRR